MILFPQHVRKRPLAQPMDVTKVALAAENLLGPLAAETQRPWEPTQKLNDLGNVIIIFAIFGS